MLHGKNAITIVDGKCRKKLISLISLKYFFNLGKQQ